MPIHSLAQNAEPSVSPSHAAQSAPPVDGAIPKTSTRDDATRKLDERLTKRAAAEVVTTHMYKAKLRKSQLYRRSGISRTYLTSLLRGEKQMSLFIFLELSQALDFVDACDLLRKVIARRTVLQAAQQRSFADTDPPVT